MDDFDHEDSKSRNDNDMTGASLPFRAFASLWSISFSASPLRRTANRLPLLAQYLHRPSWKE
jgi:hypothetical protein